MERARNARRVAGPEPGRESDRPKWRALKIPWLLGGKCMNSPPPSPLQITCTAAPCAELVGFMAVVQLEFVCFMTILTFSILRRWIHFFQSSSESAIVAIAYLATRESLITPVCKKIERFPGQMLLTIATVPSWGL